jgi:hypothetical protein
VADDRGDAAVAPVDVFSSVSRATNSAGNCSGHPELVDSSTIRVIDALFVSRIPTVTTLRSRISTPRPARPRRSSRSRVHWGRGCRGNSDVPPNTSALLTIENLWAVRSQACQAADAVMIDQSASPSMSPKPS